MSSGAFEVAKYEDNQGVIYPCKAQPESKALTLGGVANGYPTAAAVTGVPSARLRGSKRTIGVNARTVTVKLTASLEGYQDDAILTIPVFQEDVWNGYSKTQTGTYLGTAVICTGKQPEYIV